MGGYDWVSGEPGKFPALLLRPGRADMLRRVSAGVLWLALLGTAVLPAATGQGQNSAGADEPAAALVIDQQILPAAWRIENVYTMPDAQLEALSVQFSGRITGAKNYAVGAGRVKLRINLMTCASEADAEGVSARGEMRRSANAGYWRRGVQVVEIFCEQPEAVRKAAQALGVLDTAPRVWRVFLLVAPVRQMRYEAWNDAYQALRDYQAAGGARGGGAVEERTKGILFGDSVTLRTAALPWGTARYSFGNLPYSQRRHGEFTVFSLETMPRFRGVPQIGITAEIPLKPFSAYRPARPVDRARLTSATPFWPTDHAAVVSAVTSVRRRPGTEKQTAEALLQWLGTHVIFQDDVRGARAGVDRTLTAHSGRCWDFSDAFVTVCRSAGLPARQVAGWVRDAGLHMWAEVYLPPEGWVSVDPTLTWLGVSDNYVPLFISEDGTLPVVYWDTPKVEPAARGKGRGKVSG